MNKSELVDAVASRADVTKTDADAVISAMFQVIEDQVAKGDKVTIPGCLTIERTKRSARTGRNPRTGEPMDIPEQFACKISAGSRLKKAAKG